MNEDKKTDNKNYQNEELNNKDELKKETYYIDKNKNNTVEYNIDNIKIEDSEFKTNDNLDLFDVDDSSSDNKNDIDSSNSEIPDDEKLNKEDDSSMQLDDVSDNSNDSDTNSLSDDETENLDENTNDKEDDSPDDDTKNNNNNNDSKNNNNDNSDESNMQDKEKNDESLNKDDKNKDNENKSDDKKSEDNSENKDSEKKDNGNDNTSSGDKNTKEEKNGNKNDSKNSDKPRDENKPKDSAPKQNNKSEASPNKQPNSAANKKAQANAGANKSPGSKAGGIKDKAQNRLGNKIRKPQGNPGQKIADAARQKLENNKLVDAAQKGKDAIDKGKKAVDTAKKAGKAAAKAGKAAAKAAKGLIDLFVSTLPWSAIVLAVVIGIIAIILLVVFLVPGIGGNVNDDENLSSYSKTDRKTLNKIREIFEKYPSADGALAMAVVEYPYFDSLYGDDVKSFLSNGSKNSEEDEPSESEDDDTIKEEEDDDKEDVKEDDDTTSDDPYLIIFRSAKNRYRLKKVLRKLSSSQDGEFNEYLKSSYFPKDSGYWGFDKDVLTGYNGYKKMTKLVDDGDKDAFYDAIIEDLKEKKELFIDYVFETVDCSSTSQSLGYYDAGGILQGQGVVVIKDTASGDFNTIKNAKSLYGTEALNMDIKRYVMGVAYNEIGSNVKMEAAAKSVMIASQSFLLGRTAPGSSDGVGMGFKTDKKDGKTIFYMRGNSNDQGYCDIYNGCDDNAPDLYKHSKVNADVEVHNNTKGKLDATSIKNLEKWYDEIAGEFIYDTKTKGFAGNQYNTICDSCKRGYCLAHIETEELAKKGRDYKYILYSYMFSNSRYVAYNMNTKTLSVVSGECNPVTSNGACGIIDNNFIYYDQKDFASTQFCGRSGASIATSGCGVTSMAMVLSNLTDKKVTPPETMKEAYGGGFCGAGIDGTSAGYFPVAAKNHGLTYKSLAVNKKGAQEALTVLKSGGLIIANVGSASPFTSGGHYIVIRKVDANNRVYVGDPNHKNLNMTPFNINDFISKGWITHGWWAFTGSKSKSIVEKYCKNTEGDGISTGKLGYPVSGMSKPNCSDYPYYSGGNYHGGTDISVGIGTKVLAMDGGTVSISKDVPCNGRRCSGGYGSYGRYIVINHGKGIQTLYAHLSERNVKVGDKVSKGQLIGLSGNNGNSTGPHLHIEVKLNGQNQNPCNYLNK